MNQDLHARFAARRLASRAKHVSGFFALPNPWDIGGVRRLERLGFRALASTSAGYAWSFGVDDTEVGLEQTLEHLRHLCEATELPINADFENDYADEPEQLAANVVRAAATGVAGLSVDDLTDDHLYDTAFAAQRISAARQALDAVDPNIILVGRTEGFRIGRNDLHDTVEHLVAYAEAGADCLYAPMITKDDQISTIVQALAPKAVNVLFHGPGMTTERLTQLGVRRASVGSLLAKAAWLAFDEAASQLASQRSLPAALFQPQAEATLRRPTS